MGKLYLWTPQILILCFYQQLFWLRRVLNRAHELGGRRIQAPYAAVRRANSACNSTRPADVHAEAQDHPAYHRDSHCGVGMAIFGRRFGQAHGGKSLKMGRSLAHHDKHPALLQHDSHIMSTVTQYLCHELCELVPDEKDLCNADQLQHQ